MRGAGRSFVSRWFGDLGQDFHFALRRLARSRSFTLVAVLSLALGIGINTALFTYVYAMLLEPVPGVDGADGVVELLLTRRGQEQQEWAYPDFQDLREAQTPIEALAGWKPRDGSLTTADGSERVRVMYVSADYFRVLGVVPKRGRDFLPSEDVGSGEHPVAVLSYDLWRNRLGGEPEIIGGTISLNRTPYTVVGVAPEAFKGHQPVSRNTDLWVPGEGPGCAVAADAGTTARRCHGESDERGSTNRLRAVRPGIPGDQPGSGCSGLSLRADPGLRPGGKRDVHCRTDCPDGSGSADHLRERGRDGAGP